MPIASRNENLKVFPGIRIIGGNLKSEFRKILPFCLLQKRPMHSSRAHTTVRSVSANWIYFMYVHVFILLFLYRYSKSCGIFKV